MLGIAAAYIVGLRTAEFRMQADLERSREEQQALVDQLRRDLAPRPAEAAVAHAPALSAAPEESAPVTEQPVAPETYPLADTSSVAPLAMAPQPDEVQPEPIVAAVSDAPAPEAAVDDPLPAEAPPVAVAPETQEQSPAEAPAPPIARETFDAVALGTAYTEVAQRFGREGLAALTMQDASGTETKHYFWDWTGVAGQACRVSMRFVDGRLTDKIYRD